MLITLFCIWNLSNPLFTSIDVVKVMSGVVWMNDVVMNDQMELMNDQLVMSECGEVWMSDVMNDQMELMSDDEVMSGVVWMNDVVMNDQMELMNDQLVMSEWVSGMEYEWRSG